MPIPNKKENKQTTYTHNDNINKLTNTNNKLNKRQYSTMDVSSSVTAITTAAAASGSDDSMAVMYHINTEKNKNQLCREI